MKTMWNGPRSAVQIPEEFKETVAQECDYKKKQMGALAPLQKGGAYAMIRKGSGI
jgi:hypothetical protein